MSKSRFNRPLGRNRLQQATTAAHVTKNANSANCCTATAKSQLLTGAP